MTIRVLAVTEGADRPTTESFIGLRERGVDITVVCPEAHPNYQRLSAAGVPVIDIALKKNFDKPGQQALRAEP